jgi:Rrf2 family protein
MADIAQNEGRGAVTVRNVAGRQHIPENYLEQLVGVLRRSGLVRSIRGPCGGYVLSKPAAEITVGEILRALEGTLSPTGCVESEECVCGDADCGACSARNVWHMIHKGVSDVVDGMTLSDLI